MVVFSPPLPDHAQVGDPGHISDHNALLEAAKTLNSGKIDYSHHTAKGTLVSASAANVPGTLTVGTDDMVLLADSSQTLGLKWAQLPTGGITDSAVTTAKIADGSVTTAKIANGAVTTVKIADGAVTPQKISGIGNLVTRNQASGGWALGSTEGFDATAATLSYDPALGIVGTKTATGFAKISLQDAFRVPVDLTWYQTVTLYAEVNLITAGRTVSAAGVWTDAGGGTLGTVMIVPDTSTLGLSVGQITATVPEGAVWLDLDSWCGGPAGGQWAIRGLGVWKGAGGRWSLPGEPIIGLGTGANGVNTAAIQDGAVTAAKIANDTITAAQIAANAVGSSELADNAVDTAAIADGAVTDAKLAGDSVTTAKIAANSVTTAKIADSAVTTGKIANSSVDAAKIVDGSVGTSEIADAAVTAAKIANDTITAAQIAANAVGSSELADNAVDTNAIADSAVTSAKIADGALSPLLLAAARSATKLDAGTAFDGYDTTWDMIFGEPFADCGAPSAGTPTDTFDGGTP